MLMDYLNKLTLPLGRWAFKTPVFLHWSWSIMTLLLLIFYTQLVPFWLAICFIVLLHEFGHIAAAQFLNCETRDVTLYPFGGVARIMFTRDYKQEFIICLAGPFVNLLLAPFLYIGGLFSEFLFTLYMCNIVLLVFNLLPIFPMDGGRAFRAMLVFLLEDYRRATMIAGRSGQILAILMAGVGLFTGLWSLSLVAIMVVYYAEMEIAQVRRTFLSKKQNLLGQPISDEVLSSSATIFRIQERIWKLDERNRS